MPRHEFQSLWLQGELSPLEYACVKSFLAQGHRFTLYSYSNLSDLPEGCVLEDARQILPEEEIFAYTSGKTAGSVAPFANLFRYKLLDERGGWWVDADTLCLEADIPDTPYVFGKQDETTYANGHLKAPPGSPLVPTLLARAQAQGRDVAFAANGPTLLTEVVAELGLEDRAWKTSVLYPLYWTETLLPFDPGRKDEVEAKIRDSAFLHLWNQMLGLYNVLKTVRPPRGSYLDAVYDRYEVPFPTAPQYEWRDLASVAALQDEHWMLWEANDRLQEELRTASAELERLRSGQDDADDSSQKASNARFPGRLRRRASPSK